MKFQQQQQQQNYGALKVNTDAIHILMTITIMNDNNIVRNMKSTSFRVKHTTLLFVTSHTE